MKKIILSSICCIASFFVFAQKEKGYAYVATYKNIAIAEMQRTGVPASITLAQGILESQYGESDLCKKSNNHFGIKCKTEWTGEKVYHDDDLKQECFRVYPNAEASFKDHSDFLKNRPYYTSLFNLSPTDVEGWCFGLKKAGYATEKNYPQMLLKIINDYNLNQYTLIALQQQNNKTNTEVVNNNQSNNSIPANVTANRPQEELVTVTNNNTSINTTNPTTTTTYPNGVFTINHTKVVYAKAGTSLLLIANQYDLDLNKIFAYNDMQEISVLETDNLIFLEKKMKKGATDFHVVAANETLHDIAQKEGVQLESILQFNNFQKNIQLNAGEKIYLRNFTPANSKTVQPTKVSK
ncbi:MAG: glucosaminidase domain-containing protein [Bacteroidetes bacterium]|nr:glucosaminidase domain-containing protein [Bacteroidota bacterium]MBS1649720.1 glucosaminidase domain-containing protein [Bacteroidota bacterium]